MKKLLFLVVAVVFTVITSHAEGISGTWKSSMKGPQGDMEMTFVFKVDGAKLTGTMSTPMGDMELKNGKVDGNKFSFEIDMMGNSMKHTGTLDGEVIKLKMEMPEGGPGGGPGGAGGGAPGGPGGDGPGAMTLTRVK